MKEKSAEMRQKADESVAEEGMNLELLASGQCLVGSESEAETKTRLGETGIVDYPVGAGDEEEENIFQKLCPCYKVVAMELAFWFSILSIADAKSKSL